jgi:hypothetical protein
MPKVYVKHRLKIQKNMEKHYPRPIRGYINSLPASTIAGTLAGLVFALMLQPELRIKPVDESIEFSSFLHASFTSEVVPLHNIVVSKLPKRQVFPKVNSLKLLILVLWSTSKIDASVLRNYRNRIRFLQAYCRTASLISIHTSLVLFAYT